MISIFLLIVRGAWPELSRPVFTHLALERDWELAGAELPDIYAGQVAFAPIRSKGNRSELKVTGKDNSGRQWTVQLQAQAAKTELPKLIWMKRRIESIHGPFCDPPRWMVSYKGKVSAEKGEWIRQKD